MHIIINLNLIFLVFDKFNNFKARLKSQIYFFVKNLIKIIKK